MSYSENTTENQNADDLTFDFIALEEIKASPMRQKRMATVFRLRTVENLTMDAIAKQLNITIPTVYADFNAVCEKFYQQNSENLQLLVNKELSRLDTLQEAYIDSAVSGNHQSAEILIAVTKQRIKLLGLDRFAQKKLLQSEETDTSTLTINFVDDWRNSGSTKQLSPASDFSSNTNHNRW